MRPWFPTHVYAHCHLFSSAQTIQTPIDLETMGEKLRSGAYVDVANEFLADLRLTWKNAFQFYPPRSEKYELADAYRRLATSLYDLKAVPQLTAIAAAARKREMLRELKERGGDQTFDCVCELWDNAGATVQCGLCQVSGPYESETCWTGRPALNLVAIPFSPSLF